MFQERLNDVITGRHLSRSEAQQVMQLIMAGAASEAQIGALLTALRMKGETSEEITGFTEAMRSYAVKAQSAQRELVDTCGTGGDRKGTFNISTTVAFVVAGAGVAVAKHGNHGVSSACGSADVLSALGIRIDLTPDQVVQSIASQQIGFLYAPVFHPAMRYAGKVRRELGFRTVFNMLGPLTNPLGTQRQVLGVYDRNLTQKLAEVLQALGVTHAMVVHGLDGLDEISTASPTQVSEVADGNIKTYIIEPRDYGFAPCDPQSYTGGTPSDNAKLIRGILQGQRGPQRDVVLINAAAALVVAGKTEDLREGILLSAKSIDSEAALDRLEALRQFSQQLPGVVV